MPEIIVKLGERVIHRYFFDKDTLSVGRARENDIVIENLSVSRNHVRIKRQDNQYILTDLNSANGTLVNGVRVTKTELFHNDQVTVGKHTLVFLQAEEPSPEMPEVAPTMIPSDPTSAPPMPPSPMPAPGDLVGLLVVTKGKQAGQEFPILKPETFIGRAPENEIRLHDWFVSKKHAVIRREGIRFVLKDLDSWRGTTVNGSSVRETDLQKNDEVVFGTTVLQFRLLTAEEFQQHHPPGSASRQERIREEDDEWNASSAHNRLPDLRSGEAPPPASVTAAPKPAPAPAPEPAPAVSATAVAPPPVDEDEDDGIVLDSQTSVPSAVEDDEFAPMTEDELAALESEADLHEGTTEEERDNRRAAWELLAAEKMFETGEDDFTLGDPEDELTAQEKALKSDASAVEGLTARSVLKKPDAARVSAEEKEEEEALGGFDGPPAAAAATPSAASSTAVPAGNAASGDANRRQVELWEKALRNKSLVIRKNAAKELKKLTGKDYDWQSEPPGP